MINEQNVSPSVAPVSESAPVIESVQPTVNTSIPASSEPVKQEKVKTFTEDQMKVISDDVKRRTEARLRAEYEAQLKSSNTQKQQESTPGEQTQQQTGQQTQTVPSAYTEEQIYNIVKQKQAQDQEKYAQEAALNDFLTKIKAAGKGDKLEASGLGNLKLDHPLIPTLMPMLNSLDNVADVIDDFGDNPVKVANLLAVTMLNPMNGYKELQAISQSIKRNKEALAKEKAPEPLNQLKPSSYGLGGGASSISDKRRNPAFKF